MRRAPLIGSLILLAACGSVGTTSTTTSTSTNGGGGRPSSTSSSSSGSAGGATTGGAGGMTTGTTTSAPPCGGACPTGYACGTANGIEVCRSQSGIPLFSHVFVILMENTSLSSLETVMDGGNAPNLVALAGAHATGTDYHGVAHPSLPNYIALTSGDTQGITCDCHGEMGHGDCNAITCNILLGACSCNKAVTNLADQLEAAGKTWMAYGEDMKTPCNLVDSGKYAVRHVPFLYYDDIQGNQGRCASHVVDYSSFDPSAAAAFTFVAPNLDHDMHDPSPSLPPATTNIKNGDTWIGPEVAKILASPAYTQGGLLVVVWDEDDDSGVPVPDAPIPIFVMSPYAKSGGFKSAVKGDHYSLLATIEDGLGLARMGKAASTTPLSDYFPAN